MTFGELIRDRRNELKLTQADCAKSLGIAQATMRSYEHDHTLPKIQRAAKLRLILGFTLEEYYSAWEESALSQQT